MNKYKFNFSGYTLEEEIYNNIIKLKSDINEIKKMFMDDIYYICGNIIIDNDVDYTNTKVLLEQLDNLDLSISEQKA